MPDNSIDAVVSDPPYGLSFMSKGWDTFGSDVRQPGDGNYSVADNAGGRSKVRYGYGSKYAHSMRAFQERMTPVFEEALRVAKPGAHLLCFGGTRTFHRMACAIEDAGWDVRDCIMWVYGSGFPKSMDVAKAIDKGQAKSLERALEFTSWMRSTGITAQQVDAATGTKMSRKLLALDGQALVATEEMFDKLRPYLPEVPQRIEQLVAERTGVSWSDYSKRHVIAEHVKGSFGASASGFLNGLSGEYSLTEPYSEEAKQWEGWGTCLKPAWEPIIVARKPLDGTVAHNVLTWGVGAMNIDACRVPIEQGDDVFAKNPHTRSKGKDSGIYGKYDAMQTDWSGEKGRFPANLVHDGSQLVLDLFPDTGKSSGGGMHTKGTHGNARTNAYGEYSGCLPAKSIGIGDSGSAARFFYCAKASKKDRGEGNTHPTVKPTALMEWLVKLITPRGGLYSTRSWAAAPRAWPARTLAAGSWASSASGNICR